MTTNKDRAYFELTDDAGVYARKQKSDARITALVEHGAAHGGAILAYGSFNDYYTDELLRLCTLKRVNETRLEITIDGIERAIETAEKFIASRKNEDGSLKMVDE